MSTTHEAPHPTLALQQQQKQGLNQRLIMSAHMQQAIKLLQIPILELEPFIEEQVAQNPLLELVDDNVTAQDDRKKKLESLETADDEKDPSADNELSINENDFDILKHLDEDFKDYIEEGNNSTVKRTSEEDKYKSYQESSIPFETGLYGHFTQIAHDTFEDPLDLEAAEILIGYFDEYGFLKTPIQEIALLHTLEESRIQKILTIIQEFEPYGIGAASIQESMLIQLRCLKKEHTLAYEIVKEHYDELLHNRIPLIQKSLKCALEDIQKSIEQDIITLNLHPGLQFSLQKAQPIVPDVALRLDNDQLIVEVNRDYTSGLRLNRKYLKMLESNETSAETKSYIRNHIFSAKWLTRNLQQRYSTIERIAASLAVRQRDFFMKPDGKLVPLTMKVLAEELNVHESTIARTVSGKYIDTPRGLLSLRAFFTTEFMSDVGESLSSKTIQEAVLDLIQGEDKQHPLSDQKISILLKEQGIVCARRTVAKYRELLNLGNTQQRKKYNK